jgi:hypothetical protein
MGATSAQRHAPVSRPFECVCGRSLTHIGNACCGLHPPCMQTTLGTGPHGHLRHRATKERYPRRCTGSLRVRLRLRGFAFLAPHTALPLCAQPATATLAVIRSSRDDPVRRIGVGRITFRRCWCDLLRKVCYRIALTNGGPHSAEQPIKEVLDFGLSYDELLGSYPVTFDENVGPPPPRVHAACCAIDVRHSARDKSPHAAHAHAPPARTFARTAETNPEYPHNRDRAALRVCPTAR